MRRAANPNIVIMELAVIRLGALVDEMVFLGGCATGLLITDPLAPPIRATTLPNSSRPSSMACADQQRLEQMTVNEFMGLLVV